MTKTKTKTKTNIFSLYLLKQDFDEKNSLKVNHNLKQTDADNLPENATFYLANSESKAPWWKEYWGVKEDLEQILQSAIVFIPVKGRCFVATFGSAYHKLKGEAIEYNFGLITSLNALDSEKIKSADVASPENAMQYRTQSPVMENWTYFDVVQNDSIVKKLQGHSLEKYQHLFKNVSGSDSFRCGSQRSASEIKALCGELLNLFESNEYKEKFPNILNVLPVKDPNIIGRLDSELVNGFNQNNDNLVFSIPEIIGMNILNYRYKVNRRPESEIYSDISIIDFKNYLNKNGLGDRILPEVLKKYRVEMLDEDDEIKNSYQIYRCMIFDSSLESKHYHLFDGQWFEVEKDYLKSLKKELDPHFVTYPSLLNCSYKDEGKYNENMAISVPDFFCLDTKNISTSGKDKIEPCDLIIYKEDKAHMIHIKVSTRSSSLSHLFKQGVNSLHVLKSVPESKDKLKQMILEIRDDSKLLKAIDENKYHIIYGIVTSKDPSQLSDALPIFSRISLMSALRDIKIAGIECSIVLIKDEYDRKK